jgi:hypothetical protein
VSPVKYELGFCIPEDDILHSHRRENLISYMLRKCPAGYSPRSFFTELTREGHSIVPNTSLGSDIYPRPCRSVRTRPSVILHGSIAVECDMCRCCAQLSHGDQVLCVQ